jgi:hypothetical protein
MSGKAVIDRGDYALDMSHVATKGFGMELAPGGLALVQDPLTIGLDGLGHRTCFRKRGPRRIG